MCWFLHVQASASETVLQTENIKNRLRIFALVRSLFLWCEIEMIRNKYPTGGFDFMLI